MQRPLSYCDEITETIPLTGYTEEKKKRSHSYESYGSKYV